jgi:hypothetical protein
MTLQALSGVIALQLVSREGSPSLLEVRHTHTHRVCVVALVVLALAFIMLASSIVLA